jgi:DHA1 family multidrug resistance protein-like MFS transporter
MPHSSQLSYKYLGGYLLSMSEFYSIKEPFSQLLAKLLRNGKGIIPTDQKGVFVTLFFAIFSTITGVGIVVPLLPIYANDLGASGLYVGMIFGAFSISRTLLLPLFGRLSDKKGRKPFIVTGLLAYTLISFAFMISKNVETLILLRFVQGAASAMIMPVVQAYVGEITPEGSEGYSMGLFNLSMFLSLSLGPLLGGTMMEWYSLNMAFVSMGLLSGLGLGLCLVFLPTVSEEAVRSKRNPAVPWSRLLNDSEIISLFLFRYVYTSCIGIIWCFLPLFAAVRFNLPGSQIGVLVTLGVFVSGLLHLPFGYLADRLNKKVLIITGGLLSGAGMVLPLWAASFADLALAVTLFGIGGGISMPSIMACAVIKGEQKKAMGTVISIMTVAHSLGMLTGSMAAGLAMDYFDLRFSFPFGAMMMGGATLIFLFLARAHSFSPRSKDN